MKKPIIIMSLVVTKKIQVVLHLGSKSASQLITDARSYEDGITKNPTVFPNPDPSLATINTLIANLQATEVTAASRVKGAVQARNAAKKALELGMKAMAFYVEKTANANPDQAQTIAKLANMAIKSHSKRTKNDFTMVQGSNTGEVLMEAKSEKGRVTFNFEISTDISNPANWRSVQNKSVAKALVKGLVSGTRYYGRVSRTDKTGTYQLGQVLSLTVN